MCGLMLKILRECKKQFTLNKKKITNHFYRILISERLRILQIRKQFFTVLNISHTIKKNNNTEKINIVIKHLNIIKHYFCSRLIFLASMYTHIIVPSPVTNTSPSHVNFSNNRYLLHSFVECFLSWQCQEHDKACC